MRIDDFDRLDWTSVVQLGRDVLKHLTNREILIRRLHDVDWTSRNRIKQSR
ncbi:MAG: hypothetical protein MZU97_04490 [Bacillus subtilis]|nr:hypothetical protein [Bacillus subtilis]